MHIFFMVDRLHGNTFQRKKYLDADLENASGFVLYLYDRSLGRIHFIGIERFALCISHLLPAPGTNHTALCLCRFDYIRLLI